MVDEDRPVPMPRWLHTRLQPEVRMPEAMLCNAGAAQHGGPRQLVTRAGDNASAAVLLSKVEA